MRLIRRRLVRVHQIDPGPSLEGVLTGKPWRQAGNYVLKNPHVVPAPEQTIALDSKEVWIPREKVVFVELLR